MRPLNLRVLHHPPIQPPLCLAAEHLRIIRTSHVVYLKFVRVLPKKFYRIATKWGFTLLRKMLRKIFNLTQLQRGLNATLTHALKQAHACGHGHIQARN